MLSTETLTREELYKLVWAEPMITVARLYGRSDRGLGKLCARHGIPVPPRGYWAKKAAGKRVTQVPLPPRQGKQRQIIALGRAAPVVRPVPVAEEVPPEIAFERDPANLVVVDEHARINHPLVKAAAALLRARGTEEINIAYANKQRAAIHVTSKALPRALRIMQALIYALEKRAYPVTVENDKTIARVIGEPVGIYLRERQRRQARALTPYEEKQGRDGFPVNPYDLQPSGELSLHIDGAVGRAAVSDSPKQPLEEGLNNFIEALAKEALREKAWRAKREREEKERQELERQRKESEKANREAQSRIDRFNELASYWEKTEQRRRFLVELRKAVGDVTPDSNLGRWLLWADRYIESSDPLKRFTDRQQVLKVYYAGYSHEISRLRDGGLFEDPEVSDYDKKPRQPGIALCDRNTELDWLRTSLELELPEDFLLPYEVSTPGYIPRQFFVPARVLNEYRSHHRQEASTPSAVGESD